MKRVLGLTMAGILMFSATAFGATVEEAATAVNVPVLEKAADGKFDVSFGNTTTNNEYMLWVVKGVETTAANVSFTQANVMYIDQVTATAGGASFNDFLPMKTVDSTVLITGQGMNAPVIVGYIKAEGNTLSGNIGLTGRASGKLGGAVVTLTSTTDPSVVYTATTADDGTFTLTAVANGTYTMKIEKSSYLGYIDKTFEVSSETSWTEEISLIPGDINGSGRIDATDFKLLKQKLLNRGTDLPEDLNGSGRIDATDFKLLKQNLLKRTTTVN